MEERPTTIGKRSFLIRDILEVEKVQSSSEDQDGKTTDSMALFAPSFLLYKVVNLETVSK